MLKRSIMVHQPHFFPWLPYIARMAVSEYFIVFDLAQYKKRYFHNRTKILRLDNAEEWFTLPISGNSKDSMNKMNIGLQNLNIKKMKRRLSHYYNKYPYYNIYWEKLDSFFNYDLLSNLTLPNINMKSIELTFNLLDIPMPQIIYIPEIEKKQNYHSKQLMLDQIIQQDVKYFLTGWGASKMEEIIDKAIYNEKGILVKHMNKDTFDEEYNSNGLFAIHWIMLYGAKTVKQFLTRNQSKFFDA